MLLTCTDAVFGTHSSCSKAYLRWIDATTRRPEVGAARIAEAVDLLAAGIEGRARP